MDDLYDIENEARRAAKLASVHRSLRLRRAAVWLCRVALLATLAASSVGFIEVCAAGVRSAAHYVALEDAQAAASIARTPGWVWLLGALFGATLGVTWVSARRAVAALRAAESLDWRLRRRYVSRLDRRLAGRKRASRRNEVRILTDIGAACAWRYTHAETSICAPWLVRRAHTLIEDRIQRLKDELDEARGGREPDPESRRPPRDDG